MIGPLFRRLAINATFIYSARIAEGLIQLAILPVILSRVGKECYGAAILILSVQEIVELARGGMQKATVKYLAEYMARRETENANNIFSASEILQGFVGLLGLILCIAIAPFGTSIFAIPASMHHEAKISIVLLGVGIFVSFALSPWQNAVAANERYDLVSISRVSGRGFRALLIILFLGRIPFPLTTLVASYLLGNVLERLVCLLFLKKLGQTFSVRYSRSAVRLVRTLLGFSFYDFLHTLSGILYSQGPLYIAAHFISLTAVAGLGIIRNVTGLVAMAMAQVGQMLVPTVSRLNAEGAQEKLKRLILSGTNLLVFLGGIVMAALAPWMGGVLRVWLGPSYEGLAVSCIILLWATYLLDSLTCIHNSLGGVGLVKTDGISNIMSTTIGLVVTMVITYYGGGLEGLAFGLLSGRILRFLFVSYYGSKVFGMSVKDLFVEGYAKTYALVMLLILFPHIVGLRPMSPMYLLVAVIATSLIYLVLGLWFIVEPEVRKRLLTWVGTKKLRETHG